MRNKNLKAKHRLQPKTLLTLRQKTKTWQNSLVVQLQCFSRLWYDNNNKECPHT